MKVFKLSDSLLAGRTARLPEQLTGNREFRSTVLPHNGMAFLSSFKCKSPQEVIPDLGKCSKIKNKQAGAELCQAQKKLRLAKTDLHVVIFHLL